MPKRKAVSDESDFSGEDEEIVTNKKSEKKPANKKAASGGEDSHTVCELSKNRKVMVRKFKGKVYVDIREFYTGKNGEELPGKKGISLPLDQWKELKQHLEGIQKLIEDLS
ncbi:hypothetical protein M758_9G161000 [Ceratodon purpureus]|uniref:Transcriptional coactivator p15 (PC4) C-terminal domain-containing protein n=1 Tax=Ceratodon purpureus TaxID=3225 RepID=A0A8T0GWZ8_CERPU|nr:hypothetical protein KC19_9G131100 [Ceratodon purpureus]KAG0606699.1 hypothetical protein M758_9G161000 [Ceratodon purpureus]